MKDPFDFVLTPFIRYSDNGRPLEERFRVKDGMYFRAPQQIYRRHTGSKHFLHLHPSQSVLPEEFDPPLTLPLPVSASTRPGISTELRGRWHRKDPNAQEDPFNLHFHPFYRYTCSRTPLDQHLRLLPANHGERPTHKPIHFLASIRNPHDRYLWTSEYLKPQKQERYRIEGDIKLRGCLYDTFFDFNTDGVHEIWPKTGFVGRM
ncbi:uncharacterized protein LOC111621069 [Centruroides sculpturatus]|uniref:uncharacterized protein LOC111621069 n=1 Tax=Centruroides sculpturatus TaxID=218467 RepID=UPI000C6DB7C2|nr:uncharacterized protein LOC111621069 [Centruroides sculpturatus]